MSYQQVRVKEHASVLMGQSPPSSACSESAEGLPFIQGNAEFGVRHPVPRLRCSAPTRIAEAGDLLLSVRAPVGDLNQATTRTVIGRGLSALRFSAHDQEFAWHALKWSTDGLNKLAQGSTFVAVSRQDVENLEIPWHGDANKRIAAVLDAVDEAIAKTEAVIAELKQVRAGLLHDLLTCGLDEHGHPRDPIAHLEQFQDSPLGRIPRAWNVTTFTDLLAERILSDIQDGNHGELHPKESDFVEDGVPFIMATDIATGRLDLARCKRIPESICKKLRVGHAQPGDVLLSHKASVGFVARIAPEDGRVMLTPQVTYYRIARPDLLDGEFLCWLMRANRFQRQLQALAAQSTRDYVGGVRHKRADLSTFGTALAGVGQQ